MSSTGAHAAIAAPNQIVVDKSYFDTLLRRADFHTATQIPDRKDPTRVTIPRSEYEHLVQVSKEFDSLKNALYQGGLTPETFSLLTSGTDPREQLPAADTWTDEFDDQQALHRPKTFDNVLSGDSGAPWGVGVISYGTKPMPYGAAPRFQGGLRVPSSQRDIKKMANTFATLGHGVFEEGNSSIGDANTESGFGGQQADSAQRTLYFCGFPQRTTYKDLLSVIKGGRILSINMHTEWSATVTFYEGAADYLAWVKRNDIYIHSKRVDVRWADRQFRLNRHVNNKVAGGATRNIVVRNATHMSLTAERIRDDMEHIHNLIIIDITFRQGHAYISTNSVHNALFARTCMMSRKSYRGCVVEFWPDECEIPLAVRIQPTKDLRTETRKKQMSLSNRFEVPGVASDSSDSDVENHDPLKSTPVDSDDNETLESKPCHGV